MFRLEKPILGVCKKKKVATSGCSGIFLLHDHLNMWVALVFGYLYPVTFLLNPQVYNLYLHEGYRPGHTERDREITLLTQYTNTFQ